MPFLRNSILRFQIYLPPLALSANNVYSRNKYKDEAISNIVKRVYRKTRAQSNDQAELVHLLKKVRW